MGTVADLTTGTKYEFRVVAENRWGGLGVGEILIGDSMILIEENNSLK